MSERVHFQTTLRPALNLPANPIQFNTPLTTKHRILSNSGIDFFLMKLPEIPVTLFCHSRCWPESLTGHQRVRDVDVIIHEAVRLKHLMYESIHRSLANTCIRVIRCPQKMLRGFSLELTLLVDLSVKIHTSKTFLLILQIYTLFQYSNSNNHIVFN